MNPRISRTSLALLLLVGGCHIPFMKAKRIQPRSPEVVVRFSAEAKQLGSPEGPPLPKVTRTMADAVDSLGEVKDARELASSIRQQAKAMDAGDEPAKLEAAQASLQAALTAVEAAPHEQVPKGDRDQALEAARVAVQNLAQKPTPETTIDAYRQVARAMVIVTGGKTEHAHAGDLERLVLHFSVEEPDQARLVGAQILMAFSLALPETQLSIEHRDRLVRELADRADKLAAAPVLDYSAQLKDALHLMVKAIEQSSPPKPVALIVDGARRAVDQLRADRPFELQRAAAQDAVRALLDVLIVTGYSSSETGLPASNR